MLWWSNRRRIIYCYNHLEWPPGIMEFIHSRNVCWKELITFNRLLEESTQEEARLIIREKKMGATENQALTIQRRSLKRLGMWINQPLIHVSIWIRNYAITNEEDDEVEGSRRNLPTKQIKISIQLSFHDIVLLCICLYSVDVLCMIGCLH